MTKEQYKAQLKTPMWHDLRKRVLKRDKNTCRKCKATDCVLHVHHKYYTEGSKAWEYPLKAFLTLCESCHKNEHVGKAITDFIRPRVVKDVVYLPYVEPKYKVSAPVKKVKPKKYKKTKSTGNLELARNKRIRKQKAKKRK